MHLETKRLVLRYYKKSDLKALIENLNDLKVSKNMLIVPFPYAKKDAESWLNHCKENAKQKPAREYSFAIELKSECKIIGSVGVDKVDKFQGTATLGYWLGRKYWRQGIMSEALKKTLEFVFKKLKLRRVEAKVFDKNKASAGLLKKLGFKKEGLRRKAHKSKADGKINNAFIYGLLREEFKC